MVLTEERPVSHLDFASFTVRGKEYRPAYGTIRNKLSSLKKAGKIILAYKSGLAFYTRPGYPFTKKKTPPTAGRTEAQEQDRKADFLHDIVSKLPDNQRALHDIRLRFRLPGAWETASAGGKYPITPISKDIRLPEWVFGGCRAYGVTIHHNDTVSVIVACSCHPIAVDLAGLRQLTEDLTRVEERLSQLLMEEERKRAKNTSQTAEILIPPHTCWLVTMWHFGADGEYSFDKEAFHMTYDAGVRGLERVYTKDIFDHNQESPVKRIVRHEVQEYPNKTLTDAMGEKLSTVLGIQLVSNTDE